ncbi:MAG TPA: histidine phosphatase family protein [Pyrinomonadaceae bacterium]
MTTFFLIRHASCSGLGHKLWGRSPGVCLNEKGKFQAQQLAQRFNGIKLQALYSSPLERALETADTLAQNMKLDVKKNYALNEIDYGDWTGKTFEILSTDERWRRYNARRSTTIIPGGESFLDVQNRIVKELDVLSRQHTNARVALVSHADIIRAAVAYFTATPIDMIERLEISPCSVSVLGLDEESATLLTINNRCELSQLWAD